MRDRRLARVTEPGRPEAVATLPRRVNALGYAADQRLLYGLTQPPGPVRVVIMDTAGRLRGSARPPAGIARAYAAAVVGGRWVLTANDGAMWSVDIRPGSRAYLRAARIPMTARPDLGDWDAVGGGALVGVAPGRGSARLVRVGPTGVVTVLARLPGALPARGSYGAAAVDGDTLYVTHHASGGHFAVPLRDPAAARRVGADAPAAGSDAAACPPRYDFGDAPPPYPSRAGSDGPRHRLLAGPAPRLGAAVDAEPDARPTDTDDARPTTPAAELDALAPAITVPVTPDGPATLAGWLDTDGDGRFDRRATAAVPPGAAAATLRWDRPVSGARAWLRLRLYADTVPDPAPTGAVERGEVEDHHLPVRHPPPTTSAPTTPPPTTPPPTTPPPPPTTPPPTTPPPTTPAAPTPAATTPPPPSAPPPPPTTAAPIPAARTTPPAPRRTPPPTPRPTTPPPPRYAGEPPPAAPPAPTRRLPLTWTFFAGLIVPAVVAAARVAGRPGR
ncbi:hypothetical protein GCM10010123_39170 [Pilimelia anulata]|uniref:GEVED domain-containing protein n=1 Tax=Pilimelia anulata TaxID=53371 RepID=A0A8J3BI53_9ACTN|nr:GEVED domain-containing protein [Pilimelia anulata]GGK05457.1 hypothetical protein GCM10010123_39170 [Pilimelia anulata]